MAVTDAYATVDGYRSVVSKSDSGQDSDIEADLLAVSRYIDRKLGRFFTRDAAAVARTFMPVSTGRATRWDWAESENPWKYGGLTRLLYIDDLVSVTSIIIDEDRDGVFTDETALAATDYELLPRNAAFGPEPAPYGAIELTSWGTKYAWPAGARVQVTGIWGWPSVPKAIERACIQVVGILRLESARATRQISLALETSLYTSQEAQAIVTALMNQYRKVTF